MCVCVITCYGGLVRSIRVGIWCLSALWMSSYIILVIATGIYNPNTSTMTAGVYQNRSVWNPLVKNIHLVYMSTSSWLTPLRILSIISLIIPLLPLHVALYLIFILPLCPLFASSSSIPSSSFASSISSSSSFIVSVSLSACSVILSSAQSRPHIRTVEVFFFFPTPLRVPVSASSLL